MKSFLSVWCYWSEAQCVSRLQGVIVKVVELNVARVAKRMFGMVLNVGSGWVIDFDRQRALTSSLLVTKGTQSG